MGVQNLIIVLLICGVSATQLEKANSNQQKPTSSYSVQCHDSSLKDVKTDEDLYARLLPRVISPQDDDTKLAIKRMFMQYLVHSRTFLEIIRCTNSNAPQARLLQEDEDGDDGDEGGNGGGGGAAGGAGAGAGAAGGVLDNTNVLNGVRRILANVFTGNLIGVIQEGVALRGPEPVTNVFTDVLSTLFGSTATAGITGILGNLTTPAPPQTENATLSYQEQQYLIQQQQLLLAQQQGGQLGGVPGQAGGVPGQAYPGVQGQRPTGGYIPGAPGGLPPHYPQFQQQQTFPNQVLQPQQQQLGGGQTQHGIRRPGAAQQQQQLFQQQSQQIPVKPQAQIPQQPQPIYPQHQQLAGGLNRQHNQQSGTGLQGQQFAGGLQGQPSQLVGGLNRQPAVQGGGNRRKPSATIIPPLQEDYYEDKDDEEE